MRINIDDTDMDDNLSYTYNGELFTGEVVETNPAGDVIELGEYRLGVEHGR